MTLTGVPASNLVFTLCLAIICFVSPGVARRILMYDIQYICMYMGQVVKKRTIGAGQATIIKLTITLNNFITL